MAQNKLKFASFNCRGFNMSSEECVSELFKEVDILVLQEHWLHSTELSLFSSLAEDVLYCSVSPMEIDQVVPGRPYGGVALLWHRRYKHAIFPVQTALYRMAAVSITTRSGIILVIAVYLNTV